MFGYVMPCRPELKMREWGEYRSYYCGLCKELKREYGFTSRMLLNYDFVLLALLADSLSDEPCEHVQECCIANPVQKRCISCNTKGLSLAANSLVLSCAYKVNDDIQDEGGFKRIASLTLRLLLKNKKAKAAARLPQLDTVLCREMQRQADIEGTKSTSYDAASEPTSIMTGTIFSQIGKTPSQEKILYRFGLFIGKIIYYLDAAEDYESDKDKNSYNVFLLNGLSKAQAVEKAQELCRMCAGELALCYNLLDVQGYRKAILDNIVFLGLAEGIMHAGEKRARVKDTD
ncbi:MAG: DUF5685 family protein [Oscillospiraceae bacterium]